MDLARFFLDRVTETISYKEVIKSVEISFMHEESFGNEYVNVFYIVTVNERWKELTESEKGRRFRKSSKDTFRIAAVSDKNDAADKWLKLVQFRHLYESLASYAVLQLERELLPGTSIKSKGIHLWPDANYAEKYLRSAVAFDFQRREQWSQYESDIWQWGSLHSLARKTVGVSPDGIMEQFPVTDVNVCMHSGLTMSEVRQIALSHQVPVVLKGIKTIDVVHLHARRFVSALKKELSKNDSYWNNKKKEYRRAINWLYDEILQKDRISHLTHQRQLFLSHFVIQSGDVLQLKDKRIVLAHSASLDNNDDVLVTYAGLKNDFQPSERIRTVPVEEITHILKKHRFDEYIANNPVRFLSVFRKWMGKNKDELMIPYFEPDIFSE